MTSSCNYYRKCSGCTKLQFPYVKQLRDKTAAARERLERHTAGRQVKDVVADVLSMPFPCIGFNDDEEAINSVTLNFGDAPFKHIPPPEVAELSCAMRG